MLSTLRNAAVAVAVGTCICAASSVARAQDYVIRFSNAVDNRADVSTRAALLFQKEVEANSKGRVKVQMFYGNQLGSLPAILDQVKDGTIQMNDTGLPFLTKYVPDAQAFGLPFLFKDAATAHAAFDGPIGTELRKLVAEKAGIRILAIGEYGFVNILNAKRPVKTLTDLKGLRIRTTPSPIAIATFKQMGAVPVSLDYAEIYTAIQRGVLDGTDQALPIIYDSKFYEVGKYVTETDHFFNAMVFNINAKFFDSLPPDLQKVVQDAALKAQAFDREAMTEENAKARQAMLAKGVAILAPDDAALAAFREAVAPVYAEAKAKGSFGEAGTRWMDELSKGR